jgi:aspartyl-tRNA(Asn)/glutamyl-tRNA(Gln) amidotransferase subunit A
VRRQVRRGQRGGQRVQGVQPVPLGAEANWAHLGRVRGEPGILGGGGSDRVGHPFEGLIRGPARREAHPDAHGGLRVAWSPRLGSAEVSGEVLDLTSAAVKLLASLGCAVEPADPPIGDLRELRAVFAATVARDSDLAGLRDLASHHDVSVDLRELVTHPWDAETLTAAAMRRQTLYDAVREFMQTYDVLLTPTTATTAFPLGLRAPEYGAEGIPDGREWSPFAFPFNLTGQPAASLPVGRTSAGLPVGLQIVGRRLDDRTVLRVAYALEQALAA